MTNATITLTIATRTLGEKPNSYTIPKPPTTVSVQDALYQYQHSLGEEIDLAREKEQGVLHLHNGTEIEKRKERKEHHAHMVEGLMKLEELNTDMKTQMAEMKREMVEMKQRMTWMENRAYYDSCHHQEVARARIMKVESMTSVVHGLNDIIINTGI